MPINSGYSFYEYAGDGVTTRFPVQFSLGELKRAYVTCRVDNEVDGEDAPLYRALSDVPGDPGMIEVLGDVPGVGVPIVFRRIVPKELLLHLYANGSILDYPSLDESHLQLMMALHEVLDGYGLTNVFTDINMNEYKLTNVYSDPDDPDSIATVAFLGTYRQDALNAAIAAADSALEALGYRDAALMHANTAAAQVGLCQGQVDLAEAQVVLATAQAVLSSGYADDSAASALEAAGYATTLSGAIDDIGVLDTRLDAAELDIVALETNKLDSAEIVAPGDALMFVCRAWAAFNGVANPAVIAGSGNVSSVTYNAANDYTINFATPMPDTGYSVGFSLGYAAATTSSGVGSFFVKSKTVNSVRIVSSLSVGLQEFVSVFVLR